MDDGELTNDTANADLQPNATYTWTNDSIPAVVYTFVTSGVVEGTAPTGLASPTGIAAGNHSTASSQDLVGSAVLPFRGELVGAVTAAGKLSLAFDGARVTHLLAGRYTITVTDRSSEKGFTLGEGKRAPVHVTGAAFVGKRSATLALTAGEAFFASRLTGPKIAFTVAG